MQTVLETRGGFGKYRIRYFQLLPGFALYGIKGQFNLICRG